MRTSLNGVKLVEGFESLHDGDLSKVGLQPKMDPVGIWTEGYGRAMRDNKGNFIKGIVNKELANSRITIRTKEDARVALLQDLEIHERLVTSKIKIPLNQNQFDALVSYSYNTGGSNTLYSLINKKSSEDVIRGWFTTRYITGQGSKKPLQGLVNRRNAEANLFFKK